jgi:hemolysin III
LAIVAMPGLVRRLDAWALVLLIVGGVIYTVGSIGLGTRWPNPLPHIFGYHEVWHVLVVLAVACHYAVVWSAVG